MDFIYYKVFSCNFNFIIFIIIYFFNFKEFGPVYEADDPNQFMRHMEALMALGGGDEPEMCFSAIQVNLEAKIFRVKKTTKKHFDNTKQKKMFVNNVLWQCLRTLLIKTQT